MKKVLMFFLILCLAAAPGLSARGEFSWRPDHEEAFAELLSSLVDAYEDPSAENTLRMEACLKAVEDASSRDFEIASAITEHWKKVYLDPDYTLLLYPSEEDPATLEIPDETAHAFVVLGFELKDGEMQEELKGRCEAAAAAARAFPGSVLVCSGGATGSNNPEKHTEAGLMKAYLTETCGLEASRILTDEKAMTTAENALNTFGMLRDRGIQTMTIVTSAYHQRWGQVLYNALAAVYRQQEGYSAEIIGNYCLDIDTDVDMFKADDRIAISQLSGMLGLSSR